MGDQIPEGLQFCKSEADMTHWITRLSEQLGYAGIVLLMFQWGPLSRSRSAPALDRASSNA